MAYVFEAEPVLAAQLLLHLFEDGGGPAHLLALAGEAQLVVAVDDLNAEGQPFLNPENVQVARDRLGLYDFRRLQMDTQQMAERMRGSREQMMDQRRSRQRGEGK